MSRRSSLVAVAIGVLAALAPAGVALADPAGPTDYGSQITSIEPPAPEIDVEIVGGDSFLRLIVEPGNEVVVTGYAQEPYLHFDPAGVVTENQRSPATYLNAVALRRHGPGRRRSDAAARLEDRRHRRLVRVARPPRPLDEPEPARRRGAAAARSRRPPSRSSSTAPR